MKRFSRLLLMLGISGGLSAQETSGPQMETALAETGIPGAIADGTRPAPPPAAVPPDFDVIRSVTKQVEVSQSPELPDLPPVEGTIRMTVQQVENPNFPAVERALTPQVVWNDPEVQARVDQAREEFRETKILLVSASVYEGKTLLKVYPNGVGRREVTVISNLDFNDFSGFATWQAKGVGADGQEEVRQYVNIMALGNGEEEQFRRIAAHHGWDPVPQVPAGEEPGFTWIEGDDTEALQAISDMHALYRVEGERMKAARIARDAAYQARKAYLLANPEKPRDVTIRVWKRDASEIRFPQTGGAQ